MQEPRELPSGKEDRSDICQHTALLLEWQNASRSGSTGNVEEMLLATLMEAFPEGLQISILNASQRI